MLQRMLESFPPSLQQSRAVVEDDILKLYVFYPVIRVWFWVERGWFAQSIMRSVLVDESNHVWWDKRWCPLFSSTPRRVVYGSTARFVEHVLALRCHGVQRPNDAKLELVLNPCGEHVSRHYLGRINA